MVTSCIGGAQIAAVHGVHPSRGEGPHDANLSFCRMQRHDKRTSHYLERRHAFKVGKDTLEDATICVIDLIKGEGQDDVSTEFGHGYSTTILPKIICMPQ
jgi:hypothetical protein